MAKSATKAQQRCLEDERHFLDEELRKCAYCSESYAEHSRCWSESSRESGDRSRACFM